MCRRLAPVCWSKYPATKALTEHVEHCTSARPAANLTCNCSTAHCCRHLSLLLRSLSGGRSRLAASRHPSEQTLYNLHHSRVLLPVSCKDTVCCCLCHVRAHHYTGQACSGSNGPTAIYPVPVCLVLTMLQHRALMQPS
jgi:hypothetical protein